MKIVYCIPSCYNSGGMERVLSIKANYLASHNYDITIITTSQHSKKPYFPLSSAIRLIDLEINYDQIEKLPLYKKILPLKNKKSLHKKRLQEALENIKADIVISMFTHEVSFLCKIKDGSTKILELHFSKHFRELDDKYNKATFLKKLSSKILNLRDFHAAKKYDKFVVLTKEDKEDWGKLSNITVIQNPIPFNHNNRTNLHSKNAIAVGRLCSQKGFDMLVEIWSKIDSEIRSQWHLTIFGAGPDEQKLRNLIFKYKLAESISIHAPVKNIEDEYLKCSIMCFTSRYEGFGMSLFEAMSCGLACISFNCPCGPSEIINKKNGKLINAFDTATYASELTELMLNEDLRKNLGTNAIVDIHEKLAIDVVMQKWINLFNTL